MVQHLGLAQLSWMRRLDDTLWGLDAARRRSRELSVLYVQRYASPRVDAQMSEHPFWELIFVFRGTGVLRSDIQIPLRPHTACLIPPKRGHAEDSGAMLDTLWIGLTGSRLRSLDKNEILTIHSEELEPLAEWIWLLSQRRHAGSGPEIDGLTGALLSRLLRLTADRPDTLVEEAMDYLHRNAAKQISMSRLAERLGYSEGYFYREFRRMTGQTPLQMLTKIRVVNALQILGQSSLEINRIAHLVGFQDPLYFSRVFKRMTGLTPNEARQHDVRQCLDRLDAPGPLKQMDKR